MQVANPKRAQFQKKLHFIPSDFPHFLKSTIGKELAPSITALVPPFPILLTLSFLNSPELRLLIGKKGRIF